MKTYLDDVPKKHIDLYSRVEQLWQYAPSLLDIFHLGIVVGPDILLTIYFQVALVLTFLYITPSLPSPASLSATVLRVRSASLTIVTGRGTRQADQTCRLAACIKHRVVWRTWECRWNP